MVALQLLLLQPGLPEEPEPAAPHPVNRTLAPARGAARLGLGSRPGAGRAVEESMAGHWVIQPNRPVMAFSSGIPLLLSKLLSCLSTPHG